MKRVRAKKVSKGRVERATHVALFCIERDGFSKRSTIAYLQAIGFTHTERLHALVHALAWLRRARAAARASLAGSASQQTAAKGGKAPKQRHWRAGCRPGKPPTAAVGPIERANVAG